jgi:hypothetical protein
MPRKSGKEYREIGLRPDHSKWLEEQAGGPRGISRVVEACIARTMKHSDAADRIDRLQAEVDDLKQAAVKSQNRLDKIAAFLEFQVWIGVGRDEVRFDAWYQEFDKFTNNGNEESQNA